MMFSYPFFNFPNRMRYYSSPYGYSNYARYSPYYSNYSKYASSNNYTSKECFPKHNNSQSSSYVCKNEEPKNHDNTNCTSDTDRISEDRPCFEIMGIKLYFDDVLLICLIFFLYCEGVQDEMLFMALVLLLLS